ncbi:MAG TPA: hypothetical protein VK925_01360 [Jiangellaceae bacterium]|nr:hypothetical protein [Jiangellaceae bacterium]
MGRPKPEIPEDDSAEHQRLDEQRVEDPGETDRWEELKRQQDSEERT